ncbi:hypothetical protein LCGC14_2383400 [marine sediment metagenome]|uniref:Uncharacterized protein n=1 Tax=marine sediment metagenome TaxID=412755 RepID=A0A0F9CMD7_9ZZZZ
MGRGKHIKKPATEHEGMVNEFIPEAERWADSWVPNYNSRDGRNFWTQLFLSKMNDLTIAAGLRVPFGEEKANA